MAGDWIKLEAATPDKPEIYAIAGFLNCSHGDAFLSCIRVWLWVDQQSRNGDDLGVTKNAIDRIGGVTGLCDALTNVGWIKAKNGALSIPNFDRHNGKTAKERALTKKRMETFRLRPERNEGVTREEKRREEIKSLGRATRLPPDWLPSELLTAWTLKERPDLDPTNVAAKFRDYWTAKPGRAGTKLDWDATFRNWVREERSARAQPAKIKVDL
jgi:hypothetical protein